ncbi:unnamed protein product [Mucor circinelloides]
MVSLASPTVIVRRDNSSNIRYVYIIALVMCIILWITVYKTPNSLNPSIQNMENSASSAQQQASNKNKTEHSAEEICTSETFKDGKWVYDPVQLEEPFTGADIARVAGYHCIKKFAHRCFRRGGDEVLRAKKIMDYRWQPNNCKLLELNTKKLADHFIDHPVLFVGDSITQLQFESLGCLLGEHFPNRHPAKSDLNGGNTKIRVNEKAPENKDTAAMAYIRSDYLLRLDDFKVISPFESVGTQLGRGENYPWVHALSKFDYIIINTGPHWHPNLQWGPNANEQELLDAFKTAMKSVLAYLDQHVKPHQKVWIRTTPYGHVQCSQYKEPQENPLAPSGKTGEYEWHLFHEFDNIWRELLHKQDNRFALFDIADMSNKRGDAHSKPDADCLHTCIPGPVDEWNRLLYSEIMRQKK